MAWVTVNGIRLHYETHGSGTPVLMVMGTGSRGRVWDLHQVPALTAAGYQVVTFDNRGTSPSDECAAGFTVDDMVADTAELAEHVADGPCHFVGTSMGAQIVQELALVRPDLVRSAVLVATRGRSDPFRRALAEAEIELYESGTILPSRYNAVVRAMQNLAPRTLAESEQVRDWLDLFEMSPPPARGDRVHMEFSAMADRLAAYRRISCRCQVISFADDLVTPPHLGKEVADAITGATFELVEGCGHYGYLEDPGTVNKCIIEFLRKDG